MNILVLDMDMPHVFSIMLSSLLGCKSCCTLGCDDLQLARVVPNFTKRVGMRLPYYLLLRLRTCAVPVVTGVRASGVTGLHAGCTPVLKTQIME